MSDPFPLDAEPPPEPPGQWRLTARDHGAAEFATPPGGIKFATLGEAQDYAKDRWHGCSVWALNDANGECWVREFAGAANGYLWHCTREGNVRTWMKGKGLGLAQAGRTR